VHGRGYRFTAPVEVRQCAKVEEGRTNSPKSSPAAAILNSSVHAT
jgi:DNA-binding winged helix-turn-helix (wHTH) protein